MMRIGWWKCCLLLFGEESMYWPDDWRRSYIVPLKLGMRRWPVIIGGGKLCGKSEAQ